MTILDSNVVVASGFFIHPKIWQNAMPFQTLICVDDMRGKKETTLDDYVQAIISRMDFSKRTILVGHSYGCGLLIHLASTLKDNVKAMVMLNGIVPCQNETIFEAYQYSQQTALMNIVCLNYAKGMLELSETNDYLQCLVDKNDITKNIELVRHENINLVTSAVLNSLKNKTYPVIYIAAQQDALTPIATQINFAKRALADELKVIQGGHLSAIFQQEQWVPYVQ